MKRIIAVLGMHRGGTSAVARGLLVLGVPLGERLLDPKPDNPTGFWEDREVVDLNDRVLAAIGHDWHSLGWIADEQLRASSLRGLREQAAALLCDRLRKHDPWAFKDPRTARLLPFWESVFQSAKIRHTYAVCIRNPLSVAHSLQARNGFSFEKSFLLWALHMGPAINAAARTQSVIVDYDRLLSHPKRELLRIARQLSLPSPKSEALAEYQGQFLDRSLRHAQFRPAALHADPRFLRDFDELFGVLRGAAAGKPLQKRIANDFMRRVTALAPLFDYVKKLEREAADSSCREAAIHGELASIRSTLQVRDQELAGALSHSAQQQKALAGAEQAIAGLDQRLSERESAMAAAQAELLRNREATVELAQRVAGLDAIVEAAKRTESERAAALAAAQDGLARSLSIIAGQRASAAQARYKSEIADRDAHLGVLQQQNLAIETEVQNLRAILEGSITRRVERIVRSIWRAMRRRQFSFNATALQHLQKQIDEQGGWVSTGDDPMFMLPSGGRFPTKWVRVQIAMQIKDDVAAVPSLYVDRGIGHSESERIELPHPNHRIDSVVRLPDTVKALRFDPLEGKGQFTLGSITIREISKVEAGVFLIHRFISTHAERPRDLIALARWAKGVYSRGGWPLLKSYLSTPPELRERDDYELWVMKYDRLSRAERATIQKRIEILKIKPKLSIIMPVYNTDLRWVRAAIKSVQSQLYPNWELCISDDASTLDGLHHELREFARRDHRIRLVIREINGNISANSNTALSLASGDFVALMDADDILSEHALYWVAEEINAHPDVDLIFSDEDKIDSDGYRFDPLFKPEWNAALMLSQNVFSHLGVYRRSLIEKVGGFRMGFEGSQDHDLVLRCSRETTQDRMRHIPRILYHWRAIESSTAADSGVKPYAWDAGRRAIEEHLTHKRICAQVRRSLIAACHYQVEYPVPHPQPRVSILIPTTGKTELLEPCLNSLFERTTYDNYEVLLLINEAQLRVPERAEYLAGIEKKPNVRVAVHDDRPFNYSWVNNWGASQSTGEILCLLNDDTEIITADWLEKLVARVLLDGVGAVGPMMYYPDDTIQHAGVILGIRGVAGHAFKGASRGSLGYFSRACVEQDLSCVTAGCMAVRADVFRAMGGFREEFEIAFNDVDFCIRLRAAGWRIIWTPTVELYHRESVSVGKHNSPERTARFAKEVALMRELWGPVLDLDPNYNVNLSLGEPFRLAFPPRNCGRSMAPSHIRNSLPANTVTSSEALSVEEVSRNASV